MKILIAGGAGYIGSTVASACIDNGDIPVIIDNLVTGRREFASGREFYEGDIADGDLVDRVFADHPDIAAVVQCAALIVVPDSVADPINYYEANVVASLQFVRHLLRNGCSRMLFSSSGSIYKANDDLTVDEDSALEPLSPYARTKAVCEGMFADIAATQPIKILSLRYFNPIGSDPKLRTGLQLPRPSHALGMMIQARDDNTAFPLTGNDFATRDGTGLRDYIHVWDLAAAHVLALHEFDTVMAEDNSLAINLGTGMGTTVRELIDAFNSVVDTPIAVTEAPRRPGDSAGAATRSDRAKRLLGWEPQLSIAEGIAHTLAWFDVRKEILPDL